MLKQKDPCKKCIVRGCCEKRETECKLIEKWNHRNDWLKTLCASLVMFPLGILLGLLGVVWVASMTKHPEEDDYYF
jgi:hypothetical protein